MAEAPEDKAAEEQVPEDKDEEQAAEEQGPEAPAEEAPAAEPAEEPAAEAKPVPAPARKEKRTKPRPATPEERAEARRRNSAERRRWRARRREKRRAAGGGEGPAVIAPVSGEARRGKPKVRQGVVVSDRADKTITVRIDVTRTHRQYKKIIRESNTFHAHDERNEASVGDTVRIVETRPLSRRKRWRLSDVLERAR